MQLLPEATEQQQAIPVAITAKSILPTLHKAIPLRIEKTTILHPPEQVPKAALPFLKEQTPGPQASQLYQPAVHRC